MTRKNQTSSRTGKQAVVAAVPVNAALAAQEDFLRPVVQEVGQAILEIEMAECLLAGKYERNDQRVGYRSGYYRRRLIPRVGMLGLRVPQDRAGHLSTQIFEPYQRSEKALVAALAQRYVPGVSTRKVAAITEELGGHEFSASSLSAITQRLDEPWAEFSRRPLDPEFPQVILDARYERVREGGGIGGRAIWIAPGIDGDGRRQGQAVASAPRERAGSGQRFLRGLQARGLRGVQLVVRDAPPGIAPAVREGLPEAWWQRGYVPFLRNALEHLPRQAAADCLSERRGRSERRDGEEARRDRRLWLEKWAGK